MGKAASHKVGYIPFVILVAIMVCFVSVTRAVAYSPDPNEVPVGDQDINDGAIGFITIDGSQAKATVENISSATISGGLASYKKVDGNTDNQVLFDSVSYIVEPYSKKDLVVELPCWGQVDLFIGDILQSFAGGSRYGKRLIAAVHTKDECPVVTPDTTTPEPSSTPFVTTEPTPTVLPTSEPVITPTFNPTPSPVTTTDNDTPAIGGQVLGVTTSSHGLSLPSTGIGNFDFIVFSVYLITAGVLLRQYANKLELAK